MANHSPVIDSGAFLVIDPATRQVVVPPAHRVIGTVGEHLAEQLTFECPERIDGHDIANCARKYVSWYNVDGDLGHDELKDIRVEDGKVYATWMIRNGLTAAKGLVKFSVHFEDVSETGVTLYRWSTATCQNCEILESINAAMGAYKAIYIDGETLHFSDYTPVDHDALELDTPGVVPTGTLKITESGKHDVAQYAFAEVDMYPNGTKEITANGTHDVRGYTTAEVHVEAGKPVIEVSVRGRVTATAADLVTTHQLSAEDDPDFVPANIRKGAEIFGVVGTAYDPEFVDVTIRNRSLLHGLMVYHVGLNDATSEMQTNATKMEPDGSADFNELTLPKVLKGSVLIITTMREDALPQPWVDSALTGVTDITKRDAALGINSTGLLLIVNGTEAGTAFVDVTHFEP